MARQGFNAGRAGQVVWQGPNAGQVARPECSTSAGWHSSVQVALQRLARLKCNLEPVSDIIGHCFVVGDNICDIISCVPGTLGIEASTSAGWRGSDAGLNNESTLNHLESTMDQY